MMRENKPNAPSPQELAAYYDGELEPAARARVAAWLAEHPEMSADLEAQHALPHAAPPEPSEAAWSSVLERIDERTKTIKARQRGKLAWPRRRLLSARFWLGSVAAAGLLLAVLLSWPTSPPNPPDPAPSQARALPVLADDEVEIISMDAGDIRALVVGTSPLPRRFELAGTGEVFVVKVVGPDGVEVVKPNKVNMDDSPGVPMMWPLALAKP